jgi:hypothetical protein
MPCFEASWSSSVTVVETFISGRGIGCDAADPQQSGQRQEQHLRQLALTVMLQYPARSPLSGCSRKPCRAERRERVRRSWITPALVWARSPTIADWRPEAWRKTTSRTLKNSALAKQYVEFQKLLSLELPKIAREAGLCVDFAGFCRVWVDFRHGYAAAPTSLGRRTRL